MQRAAWFTGALAVVAVVGDGWSGRPGPLLHQVLLLPATAAFVFFVFRLLFGGGSGVWTTRRALLVCTVFEAFFGVLFVYESHHFARFGYVLHPVGIAVLILTCASLLGWVTLRRSRDARWVAGVSIGAYVAGMALSIVSFPLNYLRSDMLPVIAAADRQVLHHASPYVTLYLGNRPYAFPYLPGMIVAYLPFTAMHVDQRVGTVVYVVGAALLVLWAAVRERRAEVAALLGLFLLSPFLQYRHELYIAPHWFTLVLALVLMQRRRFVLGALVFGVSMAIYQFSWILFPFVLLNGFRRRGLPEALKLAVAGGLGALAIAGPFLHHTTNSIADNTVSQWGRLAHANADPINLSYWATYVIPTHRLLWLQAGLMVAIFGFCAVRGRCRDLADTLRWMSVALTVFVLFNVIVDGYFYLMVLLLLLAYTCAANGWWAEPVRRSVPAAMGHLPRRTPDVYTHLPGACAGLHKHADPHG